MRPPLLGSFARGLFEFAVRLYPDSFRAAYATDLWETLDDRVADARGRRGWRGAAVTAVAESWDLLRNGLVMRFRSGGGSSSAGSAGHPHPPKSGWSWNMYPIGQDIRFAARTLAKQPGFVIATLVLLGVGIGANTAVFSVVNAYLLKPLPFPEADRLVSVGFLPPNSPMDAWREIPRAAFEAQWPAEDEVIEHFVGWDIDAFTLLGAGDPEAVLGAWVTPGYFGAVGGATEIGRVLTRADAEEAAPPVAVISYGLWQRRFGGDPAVLGHTVSAFAGDRPDEAAVFTIIGVLPSNFWFVNRATEFLTPLKSTRSPSLLTLREGVTIEQASRHLAGIVSGQVDGMPASWQMHVASTHEQYTAELRPILTVLTGAVGFVLLLACANVAMLLMVRAVDREKEITVRRALGASQGRITGQLLVEGLLLAGTAGLVGIGLARLALTGLAPVVQSQLGRTVPGGVERIAVDAPALVMALVISAVTGLLFALVPALTAARADLQGALSEGSRGGTDSRRRQLTRNSLIGAELAMSLTLLIAAALMIRSARHLQGLDLGFVPDNVLTAHVSLRLQSYPGADEQTAFVDQLEARVAAIPGVQSASTLAQWPFQGAMSDRLLLEGDDPARPSGPETAQYLVTPNHFDVLRIRAVRGRTFDARDRAGSDPVAVVSEALARQLWSGRDPVGERVRFSGENEPWRTVVGVVGDVRENLTDDPMPDLYIPYHQNPRLFMFVEARLDAPVAAVVPSLRAAVAELDPTAALTRITPMSELVAQEGARPRFLAGFLGGFGVFAICIALFGVYSLISYSVGQRRREVAVRFAVGAEARDVVRLFLKRSGVVIAAGIAVGIGGGIALSRGLSTQLHGVTANDPTTYLSASVILAAGATLAVLISARRATKIDPAGMLRLE